MNRRQFIKTMFGAAAAVAAGTVLLEVPKKKTRWKVEYDRVVTPVFTKDVSELRTCDMDIRQVLADNAIKDILAECDAEIMRNMAVPKEMMKWTGERSSRGCLELPSPRWLVVG